MRTAACAADDGLTGGPAAERRANGDHLLLFERECACCRSQLLAAALRLTGNRSDAEDLVQDTMTRAYARLQSYAPGTNARAWLHRIMINTFLNGCRMRQHTPVPVPTALLETLQPPGQLVAISAATAPSAEEEALNRFAHSEFWQAVAELPECFRAVVYLCDVVGYPNADVAELTGVPVGTVMSRLHRARARLRDRLDGRSQPDQATESMALSPGDDAFRSGQRVIPSVRLSARGRRPAPPRR